MTRKREKSEVETLSDQIKTAMVEIGGKKYPGFMVTLFNGKGTTHTFSTFPADRVPDGLRAIAASIEAHALIDEMFPRMVRGAGQP